MQLTRLAAVVGTIAAAVAIWNVVGLVWFVSREDDSYAAALVALQKQEGNAAFAGKRRDARGSEAFAWNLAGRVLMLNVLSMHDAGSNLLVQLLHRNLPPDLCAGKTFSDCPGVLQPRHFWQAPSQDSDHNGIWKHANPHLIGGLVPLEHRSNMVLVTLVRAPFAQMSAWRRWGRAVRMYLIEGCTRASDDEWLTQPCRCGSNFNISICPPGREHWDNVEWGWSEYANGYHELYQLGFRAVVPLRYEDVVLNATEAVNRVRRALGFKELAYVQRLQHGFGPSGISSSAWSDAEKRIRADDYYMRFEGGDPFVACQHLQHDALERFGYQASCMRSSGTSPSLGKEFKYLKHMEYRKGGVHRWGG